MASSQISLALTIQVEIKKSNDWFIASCCALDVHSQGKTEEEALHNIQEALRLFFVSCLERHTFDDVMQECGITVDQTLQSSPRKKNHRYVGVDVPIQLLAQHRKGCECPA